MLSPVWSPNYKVHFLNGTREIAIPEAMPQTVTFLIEAICLNEYSTAPDNIEIFQWLTLLKLDENIDPAIVYTCVFTAAPEKKELLRTVVRLIHRELPLQHFRLKRLRTYISELEAESATHNLTLGEFNQTFSWTESFSLEEKAAIQERLSNIAGKLSVDRSILAEVERFVVIGAKFLGTISGLPMGVLHLQGTLDDLPSSPVCGNQYIYIKHNDQVICALSIDQAIVTVYIIDGGGKLCIRTFNTYDTGYQSIMNACKTWIQAKQI